MASGFLFKRAKKGTRAWKRGPWQMGWTDATGRRVYRSARTTSRELAQKRLNEALVKAGRGELEPVGSARFADVMRAWLDKDTRRSHEDNESKARTWLLPAFGNLPLRAITPAGIEAFARSMIEQGRKPATVWRQLALLRKVLNDAARDGILGDSPFRRVRRENLPKEPRNRPYRWYTMEDMGRLIQAAQGSDRVLVALMCFTGCRIGEAAGLRWEPDVKLDRGLIMFCRSWGNDITKGGEPRPVSADPRLLALLRAWRSECPSAELVCPDPKNGGMRYGGSGQTRWFRRLCEAAGVAVLYPHALRHSYATNIMQTGGNLYKLKATLGHTTIQLTERYAHHSPEFASEDVARLDFTVPPPADNVVPIPVAITEAPATDIMVRAEPEAASEAEPSDPVGGLVGTPRADRRQVLDFLVGRAGLEPATAGLKVSQRFRAVTRHARQCRAIGGSRRRGIRW